MDDWLLSGILGTVGSYTTGSAAILLTAAGRLVGAVLLLGLVLNLLDSTALSQAHYTLYCRN